MKTSLMYTSKTFIFLMLSVGLSSCVTIFSGKFSQVTVHTEQSSRIVVQNDTAYTSPNHRAKLKVLKSSEPLDIYIKPDSLSEKKVTIYPNKTDYIWFNLLSNYGLGILIDRRSHKRFAYRGSDFDLTGVGFVLNLINSVGLVPSTHFALRHH